MKRKPVNPLKLFPHEIFEKVQGVRAMSDRIAVLKENESFTLKTILQVNFNIWIEFDLPEGDAPYKKDKNPPEFSAGRIDKLIKELKHLVKQSKLPRARKEIKFIQMLEAMHHKDADIIIAIKDKKLNKLYSALTPALVSRAFPTLIQEKE